MDEILNFDNLTWWWYNLNAKKKRKYPSCAWIYNHLLKLLFFPCCLQKSVCPGLPNVLPFIYEQHTSLKALYCFVYLCLSSSTCIHASFISFKWLLKGHIFRDTSLSMQHEMVLRSIFIASLALSPFFPPLLYPFLFPSFFCFPFLLFFLSSFLPSSLSFSNLEILNLGHWTIYAYLDTQSCPTLCNSMDCSLRGQAPLSMEFSRKEYCSGFPFLTPGDIPDSVSFVFCSDPHILKHSVTWEALNCLYCFLTVW